MTAAAAAADALAQPSLPPGYSLDFRRAVESTMDVARRAADAGAADGLVVWALEQAGGRGRLGRQWHSPPGNLYMTMLLREECSPAVAAQLGFVAAVAVGEAAQALLDQARHGAGSVRLKWPNDVLLGGSKVAGILLESSLRPQGGLAWILCGIGLNLAAHPQDQARPSTSLASALGGAAPPAAAALERVVGAFARWRALWRADGFAPIRAAWMGLAHPVGTALVARLPGGELQGRFAGLDGDGTLLLHDAGGLMHRIAAGEVHALPRGATEKA